MNDKPGKTAYLATGWICDIAAAHEIGSTDVTVYPTRKAFIKAHPYHKECGGPVKLSITYERKGWIQISPKRLMKKLRHIKR